MSPLHGPIYYFLLDEAAAVWDVSLLGGQRPQKRKANAFMHSPFQLSAEN
jgi:hypothetical protein